MAARKAKAAAQGTKRGGRSNVGASGLQRMEGSGQSAYRKPVTYKKATTSNISRSGRTKAGR